MDLYAAGRELKARQAMFIVDRDSYVRAAAGAMLTGKPFESLADWAAQQRAGEEAAKAVSFADMRAKLRPAATIAAER
jgi:hypothetical protein